MTPSRLNEDYQILEIYSSPREERGYVASFATVTMKVTGEGYVVLR